MLTIWSYSFGGYLVFGISMPNVGAVWVGISNYFGYSQNQEIPVNSILFNDGYAITSSEKIQRKEKSKWISLKSTLLLLMSATIGVDIFKNMFWINQVDFHNKDLTSQNFGNLDFSQTALNVILGLSLLNLRNINRDIGTSSTVGVLYNFIFIDKVNALYNCNPSCVPSISIPPSQVANIGVPYSIAIFQEYGVTPRERSLCGITIIGAPACSPLNSLGGIIYSVFQCDGNIFPPWLTFTAGPNIIRGTPDKSSSVNICIYAQSDCPTIGSTAGCYTNGYIPIQAFSFNITVIPSLISYGLNQNRTYLQNTQLNILPINISTPVSTYQVSLQLLDPTAGHIKEDVQGSILGVFKPEIATWVANGNSSSVSAMLSRLMFIPALNYYRNFFIKVIVDDGYNIPAIGMINMTGIHINQKPVVSLPIGSINLLVGQAWTSPSYANTMTDVDSILSFSSTQPNGAALDSFWIQFNSGSVVYTAIPTKAQAGSNQIVLVAQDEQYSVSQTITITVSPSLSTSGVPLAAQFTENQNLTFAPITVTSIQANVTVQVQLTPAISGILQSNLSSSAGIFDPTTGLWSFFGNTAQLNNELAQFYFSPSSYFEDAVSVQVQIDDTVNTPIRNSFVMSCKIVNYAPVLINPVGNRTVFLGNSLNVDLTNTFMDYNKADRLILSASSSTGILLLWLSINNDHLVGIPPKDSVGIYNISVQASDPSGLSVIDYFFLEVKSIPTKTYVPKLNFTFSEGGVLKLKGFNVTATDADVTVTLTLYPPQAGVLGIQAASQNSRRKRFSILATQSYNPGTGIWQASGAAAEVNNFLDQVQLFPTQYFSGQVKITFEANDLVNPPAQPQIINIVIEKQYYPPVLVKQIYFTPQDFSTPIHFLVQDFFKSLNGGELSYLITELGFKDLPHFLRFDANTKTLIGNPGRGDIKTWKISATAFDGPQNTAAFFDMKITGQTWAIFLLKSIGIPMGILSGLLGAYKQRHQPWNFFAKSKYNKEMVHLAVSDDRVFVHQIGIKINEIGEIRSYSNGKPLVDGSNLPSWLKYNSELSQLKGKPTEDDIGDLQIFICRTDKRIYERFVLRITKEPVEEEKLIQKDGSTKKASGFITSDPSLFGKSGKNKRSSKVLGQNYSEGSERNTVELQEVRRVTHL